MIILVYWGYVNPMTMLTMLKLWLQDVMGCSIAVEGMMSGGAGPNPDKFLLNQGFDVLSRLMHDS